MAPEQLATWTPPPPPAPPLPQDRVGSNSTHSGLPEREDPETSQDGIPQGGSASTGSVLPRVDGRRVPNQTERKTTLKEIVDAVQSNLPQFSDSSSTQRPRM